MKTLVKITGGLIIVLFIIGFSGCSSNVNMEKIISVDNDDYILEVFKTNKNFGKGRSSGPKKIGFSNYNLEEIILELTDIPSSRVVIRNMQENPDLKLDFLYKGTDSKNINYELLRILGEELNFMFFQDSIQKKVWTLYLGDSTLLKKKTHDPSDGILTSDKWHNKHWEGTSKSIGDLALTIEQKMNVLVDEEIYFDKKYDFILSFEGMDTLIEELENGYGILLKEETRNIEFLVIEFS